MATFALSTDDGRNVTGNRRVNTGTYTGPASYATGGDSVAAADLGLSDIRYLSLGIAGNAGQTATALLRLNNAGTKIQWFVPSTNAEVANATDLSGYTATLRAEGR